MAAVAGVTDYRNADFGLRELLWMYLASQQSAWDHTAHIIAQAGSNIMSKLPRPPKEFNPYRRNAERAEYQARREERRRRRLKEAIDGAG